MQRGRGTKAPVAVRKTIRGRGGLAAAHSAAPTDRAVMQSSVVEEKDDEVFAASEPLPAEPEQQIQEEEVLVPLVSSTAESEQLDQPMDVQLIALKEPEEHKELINGNQEVQSCQPEQECHLNEDNLSVDPPRDVTSRKSSAVSNEENEDTNERRRRLARGESEVRLEEILTRVFVDLPPKTATNRSPSPPRNRTTRSAHTTTKPTNVAKGPKPPLPRPPMKKTSTAAAPPRPPTENNRGAAPKKAPLPARPAPIKGRKPVDYTEPKKTPPAPKAPLPPRQTSVTKPSAKAVPEPVPAPPKPAEEAPKSVEPVAKTPPATKNAVTKSAATIAGAAKKPVTVVKAILPPFVPKKRV